MDLEQLLRLSVFFGVLLLLLGLEWLLPRRATQQRKLRWGGNLGVVVLNALLLLALPFSAVAAALFAQFHQFGLLWYLDLGLWPKIIATIILLDCVIYWQHRIFHQLPHLWPVHRMHHTDTAIDATTGLRFHPIEIVISMAIKVVAVMLLGAPLLGVIGFEIILNATAMFSHSNIRLPHAVDKVLRLIIVTPDMHRVHHAIHDHEYNSNYGFNLSIWDRLFGSYTAQPRDGHTRMTIGQTHYRDPTEARLGKLITQPFRPPTR